MVSCLLGQLSPQQLSPQSELDWLSYGQLYSGAVVAWAVVTGQLSVTFLTSKTLISSLFRFSCIFQKN